MKVLIITPCDLPVPAIMGGAVQTLIESLVRINEEYMGMELTLVSSYNRDAFELVKTKYPKTKFIWIRQCKLLQLLDKQIDAVKRTLTHRDKQENNKYLEKIFIIEKTKRILRRFSFDKVILQNSGFLLHIFSDKDLEKKYEGRIFYHLHNVVPRNINRKVLDQCQLLLISEYLKKDTEEFLHKSIKGNFSIVKNGIPTQLFCNALSEEEKQRIRQKHNIPSGKKIIIFTGRLIPQKGVDKLLEAFQKINNDDVMLLIVGSAFFAKQINSNFEQKIFSLSLDLGKRVIFTGYVPYQEIWKYYALSDIAILPSMWEEPAGLTIIEAMAAGLPLITTKSGGILEYIENLSAIILDRDDQIVENLSYSIGMMLGDLIQWKNKAILTKKIACENFSEEAFYNRFLEAIM